MSRGQQEDRRAGALLQRRRLLAGAVLVPVLAGAGVAAACSGSTALSEPVKGKPAKPVPTAETDWQDVAKTLGRAGTLIRGSTTTPPSHAVTCTWSPRGSSSGRRSRSARTCPSSATATA